MTAAGPWRRLLAVGLLALAVRVAFALATSQGAVELQGDAGDYHHYALNLLEKGSYEDATGDRLFRMPGYALFVALVYAVSGPSVLAVQLAQCVLGALACVMIGLAATRISGERWGLACALAAAAYLGLVEPCARILSESFDSDLIAYALAAWYAFDAGPGAKAALVGALLGAACLVRPDLGLFAGAFGVLLPRLAPGYRLRHGAVLLAAFGAVLAPWVIRNTLVFGRPILGSSQSETGLYMGLALPLEHFKDIPASKRAGDIPELEEKEFYARELGSLLRETPPAKIVRAYAFNVASMFYPFLPQYDWTYVLLVPFWLWAVAALWRDERLRVLHLLLGLYVFVHVFAGGPVSRYRQPISAPLILLAGAGAVDLSRRLGPAFPRWAGGWAAFNAFVWLAAPQVRQIVLRLKQLVW
ncbi:MAG: glycosyltransferase family 39 protein [Elusimicrobia bacterium]|nr:glycosyltransferase family 39 protein [Elusimicrobiota bacterium]